jgi:hypothetical protein
MNPNSKIIDKIQKLLRLAESASVHEAAVAAAQATRLMAIHRIAAAEVEEHDAAEEEPLDEFTVETSKRSTWRWDLLWAVCGPAGCRPWAQGDARHVRYLIYGPRAAADTARYQYLLAAKAIERELASRRKAGEIVGRSECHAFRMGAIDEIARRLKQANVDAVGEVEATEESRATALARLDADGEHVEAWMLSLGLKYSGASTRRISSADGWTAGRSFGAGVSLSSDGTAIGSGRRALPPARGR